MKSSSKQEISLQGAAGLRSVGTKLIRKQKTPFQGTGELMLAYTFGSKWVGNYCECGMEKTPFLVDVGPKLEGRCKKETGIKR